MNRQPKIAFMTTVGCNVGDEFIREGIASFLDEIYEQWSPLYVNKVDLASLHTPILDEHCQVDDKFTDADIIIQAGAPVYWNINESTSYNVQWAEELWENRIFRLGENKPILNLAAGACQPYPGFAKDFLKDPLCREFAKKVDSSCLWTSVRDPLASQILYALDIRHDVLPCSAFHAARRLKTAPSVESHVGVNLMPNGGHYKLKENISDDVWKETIQVFLNDIRKRHKVLFVAHDLHEVVYAKQFITADEKIFHSPNYLDYLQIYGQCIAVVANRVHGAVCAAGFGRPAIIIGNDTRLLIADYIGIPSFYVADVDANLLTNLLEAQISSKSVETERLLQLREDSASRYIDTLKSKLDNLPFPKPQSRATKKPLKEVALASVEELQSRPYRDFMTSMNCFARRLGLRQFTDWSKIWEYPWLWINCLSQIQWQDKKLLDLGSEISPMPWLLASLGAEVVLVEMDSQWVPIWEQLKSDTGLNVTWRIVSDENLPFEAGVFDVVTSFSVIEHQQDKLAALKEVLRVLKPSGTFALSFDICEKDLGMTFPEWNGKALTMAEFEDLIWGNGSFNKKERIHWNIADATEFVAWHLQSAPHHNYAVGAAHFKKGLTIGSDNEKILVPRLDTIGDIVLLSGFLDALLMRYPKAEITLLVRDHYEQLAPLFPPQFKWLTTRLHPHRYCHEADRLALDALIKTLQDNEWDLLLLTTYNRSWIDDVIAGSTPRVTNKIALGAIRTHGEYFKPVQSYLNLSPPIDQFMSIDEWCHETDKYQSIWNAVFDSDGTLPEPHLFVSETANVQAMKILQEIGIAGEYFACAPVGGLNIPIKTWPADRFAEAICQSHKVHGFSALLVGHEAEKQALLEVQRLVEEKGGPPTFRWTGKDGDIHLLAALLEQSRFYLGNDTGPMHIAVALGVPTIGIFGGGHYPRFIPVSKMASHVAVKLPCYGCGYNCIFGDAPCIKAVQTSAVIHAINDVLHEGCDPLTERVLDRSNDSTLIEIVESARRLTSVKDAEMSSVRTECEASINSLMAQLQQQTQIVEQLQQRYEKAIEEAAQTAIDRLAAAENEILALRSSISWRITGPLRYIYSKIFSRSR